ncbi:hypothetical protein LTS18_003429 [Coniosporium uncinatum]|uniref:Uncharacterized protein n=1 Tax=Coniosporium uncinatum TaxID=93489 RepID=A0ACC3D728_9PEZI|nr:hypothetical protein LTS18_003429 [Coniosporium uncinatum]
MSSFFTTPASQRKRKRPDPTSQAALKRRNISSGGDRDKPSRSRKRRSESISSGESEDEDRSKANDLSGSEESQSDHENETAADKRRRIAEQYLESIRTEVEENPEAFDAADIDRDLIAERLKEDVAETKGKIYRRIASDLDFPSASLLQFPKNGQTTVTGIATHPPFAYTVSSDVTVIKWEIPVSPLSSEPQPKNATPRRRPVELAFARCSKSKANNPKYVGHTGPILCCAASPDGKHLATGGRDHRIVIWDVSSLKTLKPIKIFRQHRDAVTGLAFRRGTNTLYSCSSDRTIKSWNLDVMAYVETLFGHQDSVVDVDSLAMERCVSVGSRDRTARLWKVVEETQLVFRGGGNPLAKSKDRDNKGRSHAQQQKQIANTTTTTATKSKQDTSNGDISKGEDDNDDDTDVYHHHEGALSSIRLLDEETFLTGSDNGALSLWTINKKKPVHVIPYAHGFDPRMRPEDAFPETDKTMPRRAPAPRAARWITALAVVPYSDVVVSGSWDGWVRAWKVVGDNRGARGLEALGTVGRAVGGGELQVQNGDARRDASAMAGPVRGIINSLSVFERGERGQEDLVIVAGVGKDHRLGRWMGPWKADKGKNGAVMLQVSKKALVAATAEDVLPSAHALVNGELVGE